MVTRIVGLYDWHDGGYCVMEDGKVKEHIEFERYTRIKECGGDSMDYLMKHYLDKNNLTVEDVDHWVSVYPENNLKGKWGKEISFYPHHFCHAAHAFYSSNLKDSFIITLDSEGQEEDGIKSTCVYHAEGNNITRILSVDNSSFSLGRLWGRLTRYVFKLSAGYPRGHQAGTVMAMAALGDPDKYYEDVLRMIQKDFHLVSPSPLGAKRGVYVPPEEEVYHPYLNKYRVIAEQSDQEKYNLAAALQKVTEESIFELIDRLGQTNFKSRNICFAGGVALNSVSLGKVVSKYKDKFDNFFVPPVPYDGGHTIGACQHYWHNVLGNPRVDHFESPYLGETYSEADVRGALDNVKDEVSVVSDVSVDSCVDLLVDNKIVAVFQGRSESGRRALGNRSILASPISDSMKDLINEKVKHRQSFRPFAPSVLEEQASDWFDNCFPSPYMSFVFDFKKDKLGLAPAVEHVNKTARVQTVNADQNKNYYDMISKFHSKTGVPILLNTSFNDREPICETPEHSVNCFLRTNIDYLYFPEYGLLVEKNESSDRD
jgi:carbamoyltransferase